jgi:hypothetical protein
MLVDIPQTRPGGLFTIVIALLTLGAATAPPLRAAATCTDNPWTAGWTPKWTPLFKGIDWTSACTTRLANGQPGTRTQPMNALRIDLQAPGIGFVATSDKHTSATGQTASQFLCANHAQVAINANFAWRINNAYQLMGLAISAGQSMSQPSSVPDATYVGPMALMITRSNQASFLEATQQTPPSLYSGACTAVAGGPQRASGTVPERPVPNALNLDGGGSTTMAMSTGTGSVKLINNPSDNHSTSCQQRSVAYLLGVTANPLPTPFLPPGCCSVIACPDGTSTCQDGSGIPCRTD